MLFPELKAQSSLLSYLWVFCNLHLKDKAINPSPDDFMIKTEELWAMHHPASHIIDMGMFFPIAELNTYIQPWWQLSAAPKDST